MLDVLYQDNRIFVCIKPPGVLSTDQPGGLPSLVRQQLGEPQSCVRTVHRLDQAVGGVMVLARSRQAARILSDQVQAHHTEKIYLAAVRGCPHPREGTWQDLLWRNRQTRTTQVVDAPGKDVHPAILHYRVLQQAGDYSLVEITLETGRTHQIRCQFAHHGHPLLGDRKYGGEGDTGVALWSHRFALTHPQTGKRMRFCAPLPKTAPWNLFDFKEEHPCGTGK